MEFVDQNRCYVQFDQFGVESSFYQLNPRTNIMSDMQSIQLIAMLKQEGKLQRVLMSHDIHTKHRLVYIFQHLHNQFCVINLIIYIILFSFQRITSNFIILLNILLISFLIYMIK